MNGRDIFDGVTDIRDDLIDGAKEVPKKKKRWTRNRWMGAAAAVLALAILGGVLLRPGGGLSAYAIVQAEYPKMDPYPSGMAQLIEPVYDTLHDRWWEDVRAQQRDLGDTSDLQSFFAQSAQTFLTQTTGENRVYSPLNVYMALAMLAQLTGGLLEQQAGNIKLDAQTVLALASTVCFKAKWSDEFSKGKTAPQTFHAPGGDIQIDFMNQRDDGNYYWGDKFAAVCQYFRMGGSMWFFLPDEGVTPEELLSDAQVLDFLFTADRNEWENQKRLFINKAIPKFDVSSQFDLTGGLQALGVTDVFDETVSDFTPMTSDVDAPIAVGQVNHAARVMIDEEGCTATAFTELPAVGALPPPDDEVDFVLDRPFLFCVTGDSGLPLFVGVVNCPAGT